MLKKIFSSGNDRNSEDMGPPKKNKMKAVSPEEVIIAKLKKNNRQAKDLSPEDLRDWAITLSVPDELREAYLNTDFLETLKMYKEMNIKGEQLEEKLKESGGGILSSLQSRSTGDEARPVQHDDEDDYDSDEDENLKEMEEVQNMADFYQVGKNIRVKLVIAEICKSNSAKKLRQFLAPALTKFDRLPTFGMFHSALVIGPWYIEWNNSSLCIPRKVYSNAALISADLSSLGGQEFKLEEVRKKLSEIITEWNVSRQYNQKENNCQVFVEEVLSKIGIKSNFGGALGIFLKRLKEAGVCEISFSPPPEMREKLSLKEAKYMFETHKQLDEFVHMLIEREPEFQSKYAAEYNFLKSFDRAFWLRHYKNDKDEKYACCDPPRNCPFGDPQSTFSHPRMNY